MKHFPCLRIRQPDTFGMFVREDKLITRKSKCIFRHNIKIIAPSVFTTLREDFDGNRAYGVQRQNFRDSHAALLIYLAFCCLHRCFIVLTAAGNELPLVVIRSVQNTVQRTAVDKFLRNRKNLNQCSHGDYLSVKVLEYIVRSLRSLSYASSSSMP